MRALRSKKSWKILKRREFFSRLFLNPENRQNNEKDRGGNSWLRLSESSLTKYRKPFHGR